MSEVELEAGSSVAEQESRDRDREEESGSEPPTTSPPNLAKACFSRQCTSCGPETEGIKPKSLQTHKNDQTRTLLLLYRRHQAIRLELLSQLCRCGRSELLARVLAVHCDLLLPDCRR